MKKVTFLALIILFTVVACKKDTNTTYKIKFAVTGTDVTQFKINDGVTDHFVTAQFSGTKDTTIYLQSISTLKVDAMSDGPSLYATIFVNDIPVITGYDADEDGDSKTQVKPEYTILK